MTYTVKLRGDSSRPLVAEYLCPVHGVFSCEVIKEPNGDAPDAVACPIRISQEFEELDEPECGQPSIWTPSRLACRVKKWEVVRGKYAKPERKTYMDTRDLGEGQDLDEWKAKRAAIWEEKRQADVKEMLK